MASKINPSARPDSKTIKYNNAGIWPIKELIAAGINPVNGLPYKMGDANDIGFKLKNKELLRIIDEQDAVNRFTWYNLPNGLTGQLIERILYYRGQGILFYMETDDQFYFLPYALDGTIDVYGRFTAVTPLPFNGSAATNNGEKPKAWITGLRRKCIYDIHLEELRAEELLEGCVILNDYTPQISQTIISRSALNDPLLDVMADCIPFLHTALLNGTGVQGMRVQSQDEQSNVKTASRSINRAALTGEKFIPIVSAVEMQELTGGEVSKAEEFLLTMQSLDNYRLSMYGLENGGLFQKKSHILESEQNMNAGKASLVMQDCLTNRQNFCDVVNSIWGLGIWCEISEPAIGLDKDWDGEISDNDPQDPSYESDGTSGGGDKDE